MNKMSSLLLLFIFTVVCFFFNKKILEYTHFQYSNEIFRFSLVQIYSFFFFASTIIILSLEFLKKRFFDSLGYIFMSLTSIKIGLVFFLFNSLMNNDTAQGRIEKINFFIVFALFLAVETILSIRILNKKA
jgi:hypothetical protein